MSPAFILIVGAALCSGAIDISPVVASGQAWLGAALLTLGVGNAVTVSLTRPLLRGQLKLRILRHEARKRGLPDR